MNDSYLCIDIGTSSVKALEKSQDGQILKWGILEQNGKPFHSSITPLDEEETVKYLKILLKKMAVSATEVVASLPAFYVFTAVAETIDPEHIPAVPGAFKLRAVKISDNQFFLTAIPNDILEKYQRVFASVGLNLSRLELESSALARVLGNQNSVILILDVGQRSTTFTIANRGQVNFVAHTDFALASREPDVIIKKAETLAEEKGAKKIIVTASLSVVSGL